MVLGSINYGRRQIAYTVRFAKRSTLAISVLPNKSVELLAPVGTKQDDLEKRLRKRARWVCRQIEHFEEYTPRTPPRRYVGGETHLYMGRQYRLKIVEAAAERVRLAGAYFIVELKNREDAARVQKLLQEWYRQKAEVRLRERFERVLPLFERLGCQRPQLRMQVMTRRWGSHSLKGTITLNPDLIRAPTNCIDYVVTHELCHLVEPNHGSKFFALLGKMIPQWKTTKTLLEKKLI